MHLPCARRAVRSPVPSLKTEQTGESLSAEPVDLDAILIAREDMRTFSRRDGTAGEMLEIVIGDAQGTARVVAWVPDLFADILPGTSVHISGAKPDRRGVGRAYSLDEKSSVAVTDRVITVPFSSPVFRW